MIPVLPTARPTNPGPPGFAHFGGTEIPHSGPEADSRAMRLRSRELAKTFLQESLLSCRQLPWAPAEPIGKTFLQESFFHRPARGGNLMPAPP
jgi:hypothetical protein